MQMTLEKNLKRKLPSYIIAQDVKSGYNNVIIKDLLNKFQKTSNKFYQEKREQEQEEREQEKQGVYNLLSFMVRTPRLKIWESSKDI
jgi:hypothetical protein